MKRGIPLLQRDAIPTIFEGAPSYLSQKVTPKRSSPRKRRRLAMEHHENKQTSRLNLDEIKSYNAFKTEVSNKIRSEFPGTELHIQECTDHMLIYKLSDGLDVTLNPKINFAMRILQDLSIKMWISNVEIQSQQLKWILGHTGDKLTLWSQLFEMCRRYQDVPEPDMESRCKYLVNLLKALLCVTGFVAKKTLSHIDCSKCKVKLGSVEKPLELFVDEKSHKYFDLINRGGLTFPSNFLFTITQFAYLIFNVCISTLETEFLQLKHQKQTYLGVVERFITGHEECTDVHSICDSCGVTHLNIIMKSLGCFANTLLNNYSKNKCDDISTSKVSRKVAKFN